MKGTKKPRGKYGTGMLDDAVKRVNKSAVTKQSKLDSIMGDIQQTRGQRRRDNQNGGR